MRRLAVLLAVAAVASAQMGPAVAQRVSYRPPVAGAVVDEFRLPANRWEAGNRGIDYATVAGAPVRAAAGGEVTFAGQVGGSLHVVVLHPDGVRTSYSFLRTVGVRRGDRVVGGQPVGTSGGSLHFGARVGDRYIDPRTLFDDGPPEVHLVPDDERRPAPEVVERAHMADLARSVADAARSVADAARPADRIGGGGASSWLASGGSWLGGRVRAGSVAALGWARQAVDRGGAALGPARQYLPDRLIGAAVGDVLRTGLDWWRQRSDCTPRGEAPLPMAERRIAVLVGGLGSSSDDAAIEDVDAEGLGYRSADVVRFSYAGGTTADNPYGPTDTTVDLRRSAQGLAALLRDIQAEHPGVPVDLLAHSQGGLVARQALAYEYDSGDPGFPPVANLVTIGTPHQGADLATALAAFGSTSSGRLAGEAFSRLSPGGVDPRAESLRQLAEGSEFIRRLGRRGLPPGAQLTSIAARGDLIVPAGRARVGPGTNVVVSVPGALTDHDQLPGSAAARREVALALAGQPPTCQTLGNMLADSVTAAAISGAEDALGTGLLLGGHQVDRATGGPLATIGRMITRR